MSKSKVDMKPTQTFPQAVGEATDNTMGALFHEVLRLLTFM